MEGALSTTETFKLPNDHFNRLRKKVAITHNAIVDNEITEDRHKFFENVSQNRGFNIKIFKDIEKALEWLKG